MTALFLHGLVPAGTSPVSDGPPHELVASTGLMAVVSAAPVGLQDLSSQMLGDLALHHNAVLVAYCSRTAVLPMRFGTAFSSAKAICRHLEPSTPHHVSALEMIAPFNEYTLRLQVVGDPQVPLAMATTGRDFLARGRDMRDMRLTLTERRRAVAQKLLADLEPICRQIEAAGSPKPERVLDIAILLEKRRRNVLQTIATRFAGLTAPLGLDLIVSGPWPAYSFHFDAEFAGANHGA